MPLVYLHRDGDVAEVNTDQVATYENFLAHGWKHPEEPAAEAPTSPAPEPEEGTASPQGRKKAKP